MAYVQSTGATANFTTTVAATMTVTAGSLVLVGVNTSSINSPTITVTDGQGNSYTQFVGNASFGTQGWIFAAFAASSGSLTVTVHRGADTSNTMSFWMAEYTNVRDVTLDAGPVTAAFGLGGSCTVPNMTVAGGAHLLLYFVANGNMGGAATTPADIAVRIAGSINAGFFLGDRIVMGSGTYGGEAFTSAVSGANMAGIALGQFVGINTPMLLAHL